jgi:competence protein ComEA
MLNLTRQERLVIRFLLLFFIIGGLIHIYRLYIQAPPESRSIAAKKKATEFKNMAEAVDSLYILSHDSVNLLATDTSDINQKPVNLNTATLEELITVPHIGPVTAEKIIEYRNEHGKFKRIDDILKIKGIGVKTLERIKGEVTIE